MVPDSFFRDVNFTGCLKPALTQKDILKYTKDKAIPTIEELMPYGLEQDGLKSDKSLLSWVLNSQEVPNLAVYREQLSELNCDLKFGDKPEAKKPNGRFFGSYRPEIRLLNSGREFNWGKLFRTITGYTTSKKPLETLKQLERIRGPKEPHADKKRVLLSFDIAKFSPRRPWKWCKAIDDKSEKWWNMPSWRLNEHQYRRGKYHYLKRQVHHYADKLDRDIEGITGKPNTALHYALMSYSCMLAKKKGLLIGTADFSCLIDDGLLGADVPNEPGAEMNLALFIEDVYRIAQMDFSWDKTLISAVGCNYLNQLAKYGNPISPGMRSFVRIAHMGDEPVRSPLADHATVESTVSGAMTAGAQLDPIVVAHAFMTQRVIETWMGRTETKSIRGVSAYWYFAPVGNGGAGGQSLLNMATSAGGMAISECHSNLWAIAYRYPVLREMCMQIIKAPVRELDILDRVRMPTTVQGPNKFFRQTRLRKAVMKALTKKVSSPFLSYITRGSSDTSRQSLIDLLERAKGLHYGSLQDMWRASRMFRFETIAGKFLTSRSAAKMVGWRTLMRMFYANQSEAAIVISRWLR
jgi:hypothetical protein